jgi:ABC-type Mn2+/Zn2+ transport system permease subunit
MAHWLIDPFESGIVGRALVAGVLCAWLCSFVGCWVVLRRNVFLGDAMTHGMLPGVALATLVGVDQLIGGLVAALVMAIGVAVIGRSSQLSSDTSIGLLLVGMLALGVIVVSRSQSFAVDLTGFLFGDVFAVRRGDVAVLAAVLAVTLGAIVIGHRAFVALCFDVRKAATLGLRPHVAAPAMVALMALAMVATFHVVGTLLVLALLVAPPAAALMWSRSIPRVMLLSAAMGSAAVYVGLLISWYAGTAGGATIAAVAVLVFFASTVLARSGGVWKRAALVGVSACLAAGCGNSSHPPQIEPSASAVGDEVAEDGARELDGALTKLVLVDSVTGATSVYDAADETETPIGSSGPVDEIFGDGRLAYLRTGDGTTVVDAGAWTFDHGDHYHYFATEPSRVAELDVAATGVGATHSLAVVRTSSGSFELFDRKRLAQGLIEPPAGIAVSPDVTAAAPYGDRLLTVTADGRIRATGEAGTTDLAGECPNPSWAMPTRRAVVFGCSTGAVRVAGDGGADRFVVTAVPFPADAPLARPRTVAHRDRAEVFAGVSADAVWVLDGRRRSWTVLPVPDAVVANTAGDGTVLVLHRDGTLSAFDVESRAQTAHIVLFPGAVPTSEPQPVIDIDSERAYLNNVATREVYEIDHTSGLRVARTLRTEVAPALMVEAGR